MREQNGSGDIADQLRRHHASQKEARRDGEPQVLHPCLNESEIGDQAQIEKHQDKHQKQDPVDLPHDRGTTKEITEEHDRGAEEGLMPFDQDHKRPVQGQREQQ